MKSTKKTILLVILIISVFAAAYAGYRALSKEEIPEEPVSTAEAEVQYAADFQMEDKNGEIVDLSDFYGKPIVLNFWASWCPPCKSEMPYLEKAYETYGDDLSFLMVNLTDGEKETVETADEFIDESGYTFPVYYDTKGQGVSAYSIY